MHHVAHFPGRHHLEFVIVTFEPKAVVFTAAFPTLVFLCRQNKSIQIVIEY